MTQPFFPQNTWLSITSRAAWLHPFSRNLIRPNNHPCIFSHLATHFLCHSFSISSSSGPVLQVMKEDPYVLPESLSKKPSTMQCTKNLWFFSLCSSCKQRSGIYTLYHHPSNHFMSFRFTFEKTWNDLMGGDIKCRFRIFVCSWSKGRRIRSEERRVGKEC